MLFLRKHWLKHKRNSHYSPCHDKMITNYLFTDKKQNMIFWHFCHFCTFVSIEVIFKYFWKWTKMPFPTFQDLFIDILHVKIRPFLRILKKCILLLKKVRFPSFLTLAVGKIWSKLIKCMCNSIFYHNLTFKIHRFQRYSL